MTALKTAFYLAQAGVGAASRVAPGQFVTPAPRVYENPAHAQLANPTGALYVGELTGDRYGDDSRFDVVARADLYPVTLQEIRIPGIGVNAEGAWVLRDLGPKAAHRWAIHFRNDQSGGCHNGDYYEDYARAVEAFAMIAARALGRIASHAKPEPAEAG